MTFTDKFSFLQTSHPILYKVFARHWQTPLLEFAEQLYRRNKKFTIEPGLIQAFKEEWAAMGVPSRHSDQAIQDLLQTTVIQTSHHITPTNGPTFTSIDLISLSGLTKNQYYLAGASSCVPFSNTAWTGALSYHNTDLSRLLKEGSTAWFTAKKSAKEREMHGETEKRVSLIPSRKRDALVYNSRTDNTFLDRIKQLTPECQALIADAEPDKPYSHWAANTCTKIQKTIFQREKILFFDLNRVIARYLASVLQEERTEHPCFQLLYDPSLSNAVMQQFENPSLFAMNRKGKKSDKIDSLCFANGRIVTPDKQERMPPEQLAEHLISDQLCPGTFITFFILRFLNGIRCLGSFLQTEYLEAYRNKWLALPSPWDLHLNPDYTMTTGRISWQGDPLWPLDLSLSKRYLTVTDFSDLPMSTFWEPLLSQIKLSVRV